MSIVYDPKKILKRVAPESKIKRLINKKKLTLNRAALAFVDDLEFVKKSAISKTALKTLKDYKERFADEDEATAKKDKRQVVKDPKLLVTRVQNSMLFYVSQEIKKKYYGEKYEWLPSDADEPDPEHQLKYGKIYTVGEGEMPGDRYGCKCGMRILVDEDELELE